MMMMMMIQLSRNWLLVTILGFAIGFGVLFVGWWAYRRWVLVASDVGSPRWRTPSFRSRLPFWRRTSVQKHYELVSRHEV